MKRVLLTALIAVPSILLYARTPQITVDVALVNVVATVTDRAGRYVSHLGPEDFVVTEDGQPQEIVHFSYSSDIPVSVGIALDTSGSMENRITTATNAVERFIRMIHADDDIFLLTFADRPRLRQGVTGNRERLAAALRQVDVGGGTALYDAVDESLELIRRGAHNKKALLLITDGEDTSSTLAFDDASAAVRRAELLVYSLGIAPAAVTSSRGRVDLPPVIIGRRGRLPGGVNIPGIPIPRDPRMPPTRGAGSETVDMSVLETFADLSGGKAWRLSGDWTAGRASEIDTILDEIAAELRNQYTIGYYPAHGMKDGKWHRVEIKTTDSRYRVRARKDYLADQ